MRSVVTGIGVSPGRAVGPAVRMPDAVAEPPAGRRLPPGADTQAAAELVARSADAVRDELDAAAGAAEGDAAALLHATAAMAADPSLVADAQQRVRDQHLVPERAVWEAADAVSAQLEALGGYLAERVRDVVDVRDRLVAHLTGQPAPGVPVRAEPYVLVAQDLAPALTATLDPQRVLAVVTAAGGPTSHTAILARSRGIPAVVAAPGVLDLAEGTVLLVDGAAGTVTADPSPDAVQRVRALAGAVRAFDGEGRTADGHRVDLLANVGDPAEAQGAADAGAQGVGLFRTEFAFLGRTQAPDVEEQTAAYGRVLAAFAGRKVVVRTLDAGADKPLPFLHAAPETNPALGVRGLRVAQERPDVLEDQLTAIARAAAAHPATTTWVMAPMVATVDEAEHFVAACARHGLTTAGIMVEVPSAALLAGPMLAHAHFASIGTNDLTQYTMAADRLLGAVAGLSDPWQPAVLRLVEATALGGAAQARPVGVCGEAAADPALAVVLVGLGVTSLSMTPRALPDVAAVLGATDLATCRVLARRAADASSAADARAAVRAGLPVLAELGL
ncbi:phosphoenolpyruvate--protein phosphotransferase [Cellulomonas wangsupingiae]|uniref:Phosphoenolpyruvate-protein phosphotransferase n=1 Tax=Cellulomonas wangsupingiae TaxID=2968085 RepID=A0ABY5K7U9_9CELL|nr:phosphoenolpyruvate--protein phosphotransferase [Cellulomonas wangsupingiae]MCC2334609.1 phosphoenolpyruvate--protein phosphotransferase [Cellulomonas wangsupingiae]MCM0638670.1 phosphoenolpyruvate--protein phosphotransferase [Cellulomonas wangsupingiae]UUI66425.1 phosphoenolpyruvate--protein phosphotransferase [Cellulomonas wangsupingiae]